MYSNGQTPSDEDVEASQDLSKLKVDSLKSIAKNRGLKGYSSMNKEDLIKLIKSKKK